MNDLSWIAISYQLGGRVSKLKGDNSGMFSCFLPVVDSKSNKVDLFTPQTSTPNEVVLGFEMIRKVCIMSVICQIDITV